MFILEILKELQDLPVCFPQQCLMKLSQLAEEVMGGTSGALYSLLFEGASKNAPQWADAWQSALDLATTYSKARIGSRTMVNQISSVDKGGGGYIHLYYITISSDYKI